MAGQQPLELRIEVQILVPQLFQNRNWICDGVFDL